jgi:hypothetical protein
MNIKTYQTYKERAEAYAHKERKNKLEFDLFYPNIGDEVLYCSHSKNGTLLFSGKGVVVDMIMHRGNRLDVLYKVKDLRTELVHEVMNNVTSYPKDSVQLIYRREKPMFYCGYDKLTKQIIPNTMGKFKSDVTSELNKKFGMSWETENEFIEIRAIEITVLD